MRFRDREPDYDDFIADDPLDDGCIYTCDGCGEVCERKMVDGSFSYAGTHCTGGEPGIHHVPLWIGSKCCEDTCTEQDVRL